MSEQNDTDRLRKLEERIEALKDKEPEGPKMGEHYSQAQVGWRMVTELVAGLLIGFGIGYGLDVLFGTLPILLVIFTMLGFAAGVRVMLQTAKEVQADEAGNRADEKED
ncbi:MAG: AtpZ/AtpI family protein [Pseudomonadota bacterium]